VPIKKRISFEEFEKERKNPRIEYSMKWYNLSINGRFISKGEGREDFEDK
jgi:hypothetical protein